MKQASSDPLPRTLIHTIGGAGFVPIVEPDTFPGPISTDVQSAFWHRRSYWNYDSLKVQDLPLSKASLGGSDANQSFSQKIHTVPCFIHSRKRQRVTDWIKAKGPVQLVCTL